MRLARAVVNCPWLGESRLSTRTAVIKIMMMPAINAFCGMFKLKPDFLRAGFFLGARVVFFLGVVLRVAGFRLDAVPLRVDFVRAVTFFFVLVVFRFEPVVEVVFFFAISILSSNVPVHYSIEMAGWQGGKMYKVARLQSGKVAGSLSFATLFFTLQPCNSATV